MKSRYSGMTLIELTISLVIVSLVVLGLASMDVFTRRQLLTAQWRMIIQNEASLVVEHLQKNIVRAIGNYSTNSAVKAYLAYNGIRVLLDTNDDGVGDRWRGYQHVNFSQMWFYQNAGDGETPSGVFEVIARRLMNGTSFNCADRNSANIGLVVLQLDANRNCVNLGADRVFRSKILEITINACWDPLQLRYPCGSPDNPSVQLLSCVYMPSVATN